MGKDKTQDAHPVLTADGEVMTSAGTVITEEMLEEMGEAAEKGEYPGTPGTFVTRPGRPRLADEDLRTMGFRAPESLVVAFERKAREHGQTKSERLRDLVERDVSEG